MDLAALAPHPKEHLLHCPAQAGAAIEDEQQRLPQPPGCQVGQEGHPGIGALAEPQAEVEEDRPTVLQEHVGGQDHLLLAVGTAWNWPSRKRYTTLRSAGSRAR